MVDGVGKAGHWGYYESDKRCPAYRIDTLAYVLELSAEQTTEMRDLALRVEAEERSYKSALRSTEARRDVDELRLAVRSLEYRIAQIEDMMGQNRQSPRP